MLLLGAEAHHPLDAGPVVPAPVEEDHLPGGGEVRHVALEVPLGLLALGRSGQRDHPAEARAQVLGDALDDPTLAGRVATLEDDDHLQTLELDPLDHLHELDLETEQLVLVVPIGDFRRPAGRFPVSVPGAGP